MKKLVLLAVLAFSVSIGLNSCSIQKRVYRQGFNVEWNSELKKSKNTIIESEESDIVSNSIETKSSVENVSPISLNDDASISNEFSNENRVTENSAIFTDNSDNTQNNLSGQNAENHVKVISNKNPKKESIKNVIIKNNDKKSLKSNSNGSMSNDEIIGLVLVLIGLAPFGIKIAKGKNNKAFKTSLSLWLASWACFILGLIIAIAATSMFGVILFGVAAILYAVTFIHGLISILR